MSAPTATDANIVSKTNHLGRTTRNLSEFFDEEVAGDWLAPDVRRNDISDLQRDEGVKPERATIVSIVRSKLGVLNTKGTLPDAPLLYTARP